MHRPRITAIIAICAAYSACALIAVSGCTGVPARATFTPNPTPRPTASTTRPAPSWVDPQRPTPPWTNAPSDPDLYPQAYQTYLQFAAENMTVVRDGGADQMPPEVGKFLVGNAYSIMEAIYRFQKDNMVTDGTTQFSLPAIAPLTEDVPDGTVVALQACEAEWGAATYDKNGNQLSDDGQFMNLSYYYFRYDDQGNLIIFQIYGAAVTTCPIH